MPRRHSLGALIIREALIYAIIAVIVTAAAVLTIFAAARFFVTHLA